MSSSKKIVFAANSFNFLKSYKLSLSNFFYEKGFEVIWAFPKDQDNNLNNKDKKKIEFKKLSSSRKGIFSFFKMYFFFANTFI